jgi:hypothetical protein
MLFLIVKNLTYQMYNQQTLWTHAIAIKVNERVTNIKTLNLTNCDKKLLKIAVKCDRRDILIL